MNCLRLSALEKLGSALVHGATMELYLTPKPGLVDRHDSGSHSDLSLPLMERSICHIADYVGAIVNSLKADEVFASQRAIAVRAEQRQLDELGTNTHKGYLFLSGMLLIASWHSSSPDERALRLSLSSLAEQFFQNSKSSKTHGQRVRDRFSAGGIVDEAIGAYPSLFEAALPAYRAIRAGGGCGETASFAMLASLMQSVEDTTTLHRGGQAGLERIKRDGKTLAQMIWQGEDWRPFLYELNRAYIQMNLTIGGVADMLGIGYGWLIVSGEILIGDAGTSVGLDRPAQLAA